MRESSPAGRAVPSHNDITMPARPGSPSSAATSASRCLVNMPGVYACRRREVSFRSETSAHERVRGCLHAHWSQLPFRNPRPTTSPQESLMSLTVFIRYEIEPHQAEDFETYARRWLEIIPRCGADLVVYWLPLEGTNYEAYGLASFASLADYESYRARLRPDADRD